MSKYAVFNAAGGERSSESDDGGRGAHGATGRRGRTNIGLCIRVPTDGSSSAPASSSDTAATLTAVTWTTAFSSSTPVSRSHYTLELHASVDYPTTSTTVVSTPTILVLAESVSTGSVSSPTNVTFSPSTSNSATSNGSTTSTSSQSSLNTASLPTSSTASGVISLSATTTARLSSVLTTSTSPAPAETFTASSSSSRTSTSRSTTTSFLALASLPQSSSSVTGHDTAASFSSEFSVESALQSAASVLSGGGRVTTTDSFGVTTVLSGTADAASVEAQALELAKLLSTAASASSLISASTTRHITTSFITLTKTSAIPNASVTPGSSLGSNNATIVTQPPHGAWVFGVLGALVGAILLLVFTVGCCIRRKRRELRESMPHSSNSSFVNGLPKSTIFTGFPVTFASDMGQIQTQTEVEQTQSQQSLPQSPARSSLSSDYGREIGMTMIRQDYGYSASGQEFGYTLATHPYPARPVEEGPRYPSPPAPRQVSPPRQMSPPLESRARSPPALHDRGAPLSPRRRGSPPPTRAQKLTRHRSASVPGASANGLPAVATLYRTASLRKSSVIGLSPTPESSSKSSLSAMRANLARSMSGKRSAPPETIASLTDEEEDPFRCSSILVRPLARPSSTTTLGSIHSEGRCSSVGALEAASSVSAGYETGTSRSRSTEGPFALDNYDIETIIDPYFEVLGDSFHRSSPHMPVPFQNRDTVLSFQSSSVEESGVWPPVGF